MRSTICCISLFVTSVLLTACGQSGALYAPNDANPDKRAKYLLYKNTETTTPSSSESDAPMQQQFKAPTVSEPTP
jgi:predicted small lipoprotein YifL